MRTRLHFSAVLIIYVCFMALVLTGSTVHAEPTITQAQAVKWAMDMAEAHWEINDGSGGTQCVEFVNEYYRYLMGDTIYGHAYHFLTDQYGACPYALGWSRSEPGKVQPGDIVIWDINAYLYENGSEKAGKYGHIGVAISVNGETVRTAESCPGPDGKGGACDLYNRDISCITGVIHPAFASPVPVQVPITITLESPKTIHINKGESCQIAIKTTGNGGKIKWTSNEPKIASVSQSGVVKGTGSGYASIAARYGGKTVHCTVLVVKRSLKLSKSSITIRSGKTAKIKATVRGVSKSVTWRSSNISIATVDKKGNIKGLKGGRAKITAKANGVTKTCMVTVKVKPKITLNRTILIIRPGQKTVIVPTVTGMKKNIKWTSSNKKIATVKNGKVTGKKKGTVTITARCGRLKAKCKVTVKNEGVYHTENGESLYEDDYTQNRLFNLKIDIVGNKLYIEGKLLRLRNGKREHVTGNKHIFILSSETNYREGDVPINKDRFLYDAKNYMNMWANLDTLSLGIYVVDGKVVSVYWQ